MDAVGAPEFHIPEKIFVGSNPYRYHVNLENIRRFFCGVLFVQIIAMNECSAAKLPQPCGDPVRNCESLRDGVDGAVFKIKVPVPLCEQ